MPTERISSFFPKKSLQIKEMSEERNHILRGSGEISFMKKSQENHVITLGRF
jgi:hypothetical protein